MWLVLEEPEAGLTLKWASATDRLATRLLSRTLDREIAAGASPDVSVPRSLRAAYLVKQRTRLLFAGSLASAVTEATAPPRLRGAQVPVARRNVASALEPMRALIARLRLDSPVTACGMARVHLLLVDGSGPLYYLGSPEDLATLVTDALVELEPLREG
jgi:hypothetical protein